VGRAWHSSRRPAPSPQHSCSFCYHSAGAPARACLGRSCAPAGGALCTARTAALRHGAPRTRAAARQPRIYFNRVPPYRASPALALPLRRASQHHHQDSPSSTLRRRAWRGSKVARAWAGMSATPELRYLQKRNKRRSGVGRRGMRWRATAAAMAGRQCAPGHLDRISTLHLTS